MLIRRSLFLMIISFSLAINSQQFIVKANADEDIPITPNNDFFYVSIDYFEIDSSKFRLVVTGEIYNPLNLTLDDIKAMPVTSEIVRLTCIGYKYGAKNLTSVANFTGVKLSYILDQADINTQNAIDVSFHTPDPDGYSTSLNLTEAYWDDVILAYEMNEVPIPYEHGFPLRLVCPRFYGYKWIKWVTRIVVRDEDYQGFWEGLGFEDHPYIDLTDLPIYYPISNSIQLTDQQTSWFNIEILSMSLLNILILNRLFKTIKNKKNRYY